MDIKYVNFKGTFLFFIGIIDGYSRYIVHHELRHFMSEYDVELTLQRALEKFPGERPRVISDNGPQFISKDFTEFLRVHSLQQVRTSVAYPQSNGKMEVYMRTLNQECLLKSSFLNFQDAQEQIARFVEYYNNVRLHSSLGYLTPKEYLNGNVKERYQERQRKLEDARDNRRKAREAA
jgi:putative transposase